MSSWIKLHRKLLDWEWFDDKNVFRLFTYLLLTANHSDNKYRGYCIPAGSTVTGLNSLAEKIGLSNQQTRTALDKLKSTNEITIKTNHHFSIISITNWNEYQTNQQTNQQTDNTQERTKITNHQQTDNNTIRIKESKKEGLEKKTEPEKSSEKKPEKIMEPKKPTNPPTQKMWIETDKIKLSIEDGRNLFKRFSFDGREDKFEALIRKWGQESALPMSFTQIEIKLARANRYQAEQAQASGRKQDP